MEYNPKFMYYAGKVVCRACQWERKVNSYRRALEAHYSHVHGHYEHEDACIHEKVERVPDEVEKFYDEYWRPIVQDKRYLNDIMDQDKVKKELYNYHNLMNSVTAECLDHILEGMKLVIDKLLLVCDETRDEIIERLLAGDSFVIHKYNICVIM